MKYKFYYDETEHSRIINQQTVNADNFYDNFITVIVGWDENNETIIEKRYKEFEDKYSERKSHGELKSTILKTNQFQYGFVSMNKYNLQLVSDFLNVFDDKIYLFFSVQSKLEYVVNQLLSDYKNNMFVDMDSFKYSLIKAIHIYKPAQVIDSIYNHPDTLINRLIEFLEDRIEKNKSNLSLKSRENESFEQALLILSDIREPNSIKWDYHMPFEGFRHYLNEQGIDDYKLIIDQEGDESNTLKAAWDLGHTEVVERDSKEVFGIRMADFAAGIIAKFMKSLCTALAVERDDLQKVILDNKWFDLNAEQYKVYKKLYHVLCEINDCWYKSYAGVYADDLIVFISLLEYINHNTVEDMKNSLILQGEYFNNYSLQRLENHFRQIRNKLPVEPISNNNKDYFINHWDAKVYTDAKKQPPLIVENGQRECFVLNAGCDIKGIPTITIEEDGKNVCYRIPEQLGEWVQTLVEYSQMGEKLLPSKVLFTKREGRWYADLL